MASATFPRRLLWISTLLLAFVAAPAWPCAAQAGGVLFEGARLIVGDGSPAIESSAFLVRNGRIASVGRKGGLVAPVGVTRVDLSGKTVMPAMINVHVHIGYEGYSTWGPENYTPANVLDHLQREAFYGVAATQSVGSSPTETSLAFQRDQAAGKFAPASRFFFMPGMAPPDGGPDEILKKGTSALHAVHEVSTAAEARAAVRSIASRKIRAVKIWVDDRRGTYPKMPPEVYDAVIEEAHKAGLMVHAHAIQLADQKAVVRAGADVLVHTVAAEKLDEEYVAILRQKKPYWTTVIGLGDRSEVCDADPFVDQSYPDRILAAVRGQNCNAPTASQSARDEMLAHNVKAMVAAGVRLVLGTDAGIVARYSFGWSEHHEIARWVQFGLTPSQAIVAATSRPAEAMGLRDLGSVTEGKSADFIVLDANPLDDIRNTRRISRVYLRGALLDRTAIAERWKRN